MDELFNQQDDDGLSEEEIQEQIAEAREYLRYAEENPDEVLAFGMVLAMNHETTMLDDDNEVTSGVALRFINPRAHLAYRDLSELLRDTDAFDEHLEQMKLARDSEPDIAGLFGGGLFK